ncbi:LapB repeat-containing protein [Listeria ilorinensis]|uniref:LapB repeat-containing protein n=1 Tax=Listeria ilorinensis TaxID=2867439 RepID=UPI001EF3E387|nr:LapB repeat-containing protein [Listeria ilorinensis]
MKKIIFFVIISLSFLVSLQHPLAAETDAVSRPVISHQNDYLSYEEGSNLTEAQLIQDYGITATNGGVITTDLETAVDQNQYGEYSVTITATNEAGSSTDDVTVVMTPKLNLDHHIQYIEGDEISNEQFLSDIHAEAHGTDLGVRLYTDFDQTVDLAMPGEYTAKVAADDYWSEEIIRTIKSVEVTVVPLELTADAEITYIQNTSVSSEQFLQDIHATTNASIPVDSNFNEAADLTQPGDYTVSVQAVNQNASREQEVVVHVLPSDDETNVVPPPKDPTNSDEKPQVIDRPTEQTTQAGEPKVVSSSKMTAYENEMTKNLPKTGDRSVMLPLILGSIFVLAGCYLLRKKTSYQ